MATDGSRISTPAGPVQIDTDLPHRYLALAESADPPEIAAAAAIRARLHDPDVALPAAATAGQWERLRAVLPAEVLAHPDADRALALAAEGMYTVETLYGGPVTGCVHPIVGELERPGYGVYAHYHHGHGLLEAATTLYQHFRGADHGTADFLDALPADMFSDAVYGNGRRSDSPAGYDELRAARLVYGRAVAAGYPRERAERLHAAVMGTAFSEATGGQAGREDRDPVVAAVAGADLQILSTRASVAAAMDLAIENGCSERFSPDRVLGTAAAEAGVRLRSTTAGLAFIDSRPELREWLARTLHGNAVFTEKIYQYPDGWTLEDKAVRAANAELQHQLADQIAAGELSAVDAYNHALARRHGH